MSVNPTTSSTSIFKHSCYSSKAVYEITALAFAVLAGIALTALAYKLGPVGSVSFYLALSGGGAAIFLATTALLCVAIVKYRVGLKQFQELKERINEESISNSAQHAQTLITSINPGFFTVKSQEDAKEFCTSALNAVGSTVSFPKPGVGFSEMPDIGLCRSIFHLSESKGVEKDIVQSSKDTKNIHVYQVASQYNAAEANFRGTPAIGKAIHASEKDTTQGTLAQRTNPVAFELVTAFLTHLGFNMLEKVVPSAGKTYDNTAGNYYYGLEMGSQSSKTSASVVHGWLCPSDDTIEQFTKEFKKNYSKMECVCYSSIPKGGSQPIYLLLQAAPALGHARKFCGLTDKDKEQKTESEQYSVEQQNELEKYNAFANYLTLFRQGIELGKKTRKPIVLHASLVGCGAFGNSFENVAWGFKQAALNLQNEMIQHDVHVQIEAFSEPSTDSKAENNNSPWVEFANANNIETKDRMEGQKRKSPQIHVGRVITYN